MIVVVEFVAVAVALVDDKGAVEAVGQAAQNQLAGLASQAHGAAFVGDFLLLVQQRDDGVGGGRVEFRGVGLVQFQNIAREFNGGHLHAQAKAQIRNFVLARVAGGLNLAFDAPFAEAAGHQDAAQPLQHFLRPAFLNGLRLHLLDFHPAVIGHPAVGDGFID